MTNYLQQWQEQGYLVIPGVFDPARIAGLHELCESAYAQWREHSTPKNQPMSFAYGPRAWLLLHLNHAGYYQERPEWLARLLDAIAEPLALEILRDLFREEPVFMQANYYIDPPGESWAGAWHRDSQFFTNGDEEKERADLAAEADPPRELHMHIPLVPTAATAVVPGSHLRWDTEEENRIRRHDPQAGIMPNGERLALQPGDLAFFHVNTLHRGYYEHGVPRRTIAVTLGRASHARGNSAQTMKEWRGYVATYQPWLLKPGYLEGTAPATREFFQHYIDTYGDTWKPEYLELLEPELQRYFRDF